MNGSSGAGQSREVVTAGQRARRSAAGPATARARREPTGDHVAGWRWWVLGILCLGLLMTDIDTTVLNVALPTLVRDLNASTNQLQWIVDAYALVFGGLLLTAGSLSDRLGRKWVLVAGLGVFGVGSAFCAYAGSVLPLTLARGGMGIGGAMVMPSSLAIVTNIFKNPVERGRAVGIWSGTAGLGVAIGPLLGGWLLAHFWWGSVFLINVPVAAVTLLASIWLVPNSRDRNAPPSDIVGSVLSVLALGVLLWGIIEAPVHGWTSPDTFGAVTGGVALLALFVVWERHSPHPMLDIGLFAERAFSASIGSLFLVLFALSGALFMFTQYLQFVLGESAFRTGILIAPVSAVLFISSAISSFLVHKLGPRLVIPVGLIIVAVGLWTSADLSVGFAYSAMVWRFVLVGAGIGFVMAPAIDMVLGVVPVERSGVGSATSSAMIQIGGALGVGVLGSVLSTRYQDHLAPLLAGHPIPAEARNAILSSVGGALAVAARAGGHLGDELSHVAKLAFTSGMDLSLIVGACATLAGVLVAALFLPTRLEGLHTPPAPPAADPGAGPGAPPGDDAPASAADGAPGERRDAG